MNFVSYLPKKSRLNTLRNWYIGDSTFENQNNDILTRNTKVRYKTKKYKEEFIRQVILKNIKPKTGLDFDKTNYLCKNSIMPKEFTTKEDVERGFKALDKKHIKFIQYMNDFDINNALLRVDLPSGKSVVKSIVINRWHDNVNSLFLEKYRLNPKKDTLDIVDGSVGSYPNMFIVIKSNQLKEFFYIIENFDNSDNMRNKMKKFLVSRSDSNFWQVYDWFQNWYFKSKPIKSGLYDLNRYYRKPF
jgi:hypothetical protein